MNKPTEYSDEARLLEGLRSGRNEAFKFVYQNYYMSIKNIVYRFSKEDQDVKDVMQDTIVALHNNVVHNRFKKNSRLKTYTLAIAKNIAYKRFSKNINLPLELDIQNVEIESTDDDRIKKIEESMIAHISKECRELLIYFYFEGKSYKEISQLMNYTPSFAKNKKGRCMNQLRKAVLSKKNDI